MPIFGLRADDVVLAFVIVRDLSGSEGCSYSDAKAARTVLLHQ